MMNEEAQTHKHVVPQFDVEFDDDAKSMSEIIEDATRPVESVTKPAIDHLDDAIVFVDNAPHFTPEPDSYVVIERNYPNQGELLWFDTRVYRVVSVNQETGDLALYDEEWEHHALSNFITGPARYRYRFKVPRQQKGIIKFELGKKRRRKKFRGQDVKKAAKIETDEQPNKTRRMYVTRGVLHTRLKGQAYAPVNGETRVTALDRMIVTVKGDVLIVEHPSDHWKEEWPKTNM